MLNITKNRIDQFVKLEQFKSGQIFKEQKQGFRKTNPFV